MTLSAKHTVYPVGVELLSGASAVATLRPGETPILLALFPGSNSLIAFRCLPDGSVVQVDQYTVEGGPIAGVDRTIEVVDEAVVLISGFSSLSTQLLNIGAMGQISDTPVHLWAGDFLTGQRHVQTVETADGFSVFSYGGDGHFVDVSKVSLDGTLMSNDNFNIISGVSESSYQNVSDLIVVEHSDEVWVLAALEGTSTVAVLRQNAEGSLEQVDEVGLVSGIGLNAPKTLLSVSFDDTVFIIAGSTLSSSLTVFELTQEGALLPVTHVTDTRDTRFGNVTSMANLEVNGSELVFAAGSDGGVSVFRLSSSGVLVHLETFESTAEYEVPSISSLSVTVLNDEILVFVASERNTFVTTLSMPFSDLGGDFQTRPGSLELIGTEFDDVLVASDMNATLTGGGGADHFVFTANVEVVGELGEIQDFDPAFDHILFPNQSLLVNVDQFEIESLVDGAVLSYNSVSLVVRSADGLSLGPDDFSHETFFELDAHSVGSYFDSIDVPDPEPVGETLIGTESNDQLFGGAGDDVIYGNNGSDKIVGGVGDDEIFGGLDEFDRRDEIFSGEGDDLVDAGYGNDLVYGQDGADTIIGGFGADTLVGQNGDDVILGGALSDLIFGNAGDDFLNGGFGFDRVNGGGGADRFYHLGIFDHGTDWIQDFNASEGDTLVFGNSEAGREDFQVNYTQTEGAGDPEVREAFVIYRETGQIIWALIDGAGEETIELQIGEDIFDIA